MCLWKHSLSGDKARATIATRRITIWARAVCRSRPPARATHHHIAGSIVAAKFGRNLMSTGQEVFVPFDGEPIVAQCGDVLVFSSRQAVLLKDGVLGGEYRIDQAALILV